MFKYFIKFLSKPTSFILILVVLTLNTSPLLATNLSWPTEDNSFFEGAAVASLIQPAASGTTESGLFGYARNNGTRFHEGIDIKPKKHDRKGEATDKILAAMDGQVVHINKVAGDSNYGRYIVLVHPNVQPSIYTLYAHLSSIEAGIKVGKEVHAGQKIATMGRSSNTPIPKERAHLHFEMGLMLSENFEHWYKKQKYGNPNKHTLWNGFNLTGFDPMDFYTQWKEGKIAGVNDYFKTIPVAFSLRVFNKKVPSFIKRYPSLSTKPITPSKIQGWDIDFTWYALPFRWTPLYDPAINGNATTPVLTAYNANVFEHHNCSETLVVKKAGTGKGKGEAPIYGKVLKKTLCLLFEY